MGDDRIAILPKPGASGFLFFSPRELVFENAHVQKHGRNVATDDAPQGIVVDAEIAVDQPVASGDNEPPRDLRIGRTHCVRDMGRRLADQITVALGGIVVKAAGNETLLIEAVGIRDDFLRKADHIV